MSTIDDKLRGLSPQARALLELRLKKKARQPSVAAGEEVSIPRRSADEAPVLSFGQERMWFLEQWEPGSARYAVPLALRLRGELDPAAVESSLQLILRRHEVLRTVYPDVEGRPAPRLAPVSRHVSPVVDLSDLASGRAEDLARELPRRLALRPFDLSSGPLLRASVLRLAADHHVVVLVLHHIVSDGWSIGILLREFSVLYGAHRQGQPANLEELPVQYADYAAWQRRRLGGERLGRLLDRWREVLADAPQELELPLDAPSREGAGERGGVVEKPWEATLWQRLLRDAEAAGVTPFIYLTAVYSVLLARVSGQWELVVGTPVAGRLVPETEPLQGFFVNTLPLRLQPLPQASFESWLEVVRGIVVGAFDHQELPFARMVEAFAHRVRGRSALFQVAIAVQSSPLPPLELDGLRAEPQRVVTGVPKFDLSLDATETDGALTVAFEYDAALFDKSTIVGLLDRLRRLVEAVLDDSCRPLATLPLLSAAERHTVLEEWAGEKHPLPPELCLHRRFEAVARRHPDIEAVRDDSGAWTYGELEENSRRLAAHLLDLGFSAGAVAGVRVGRRREAVLAMLAVLRAGGTYLPVDPTYPVSRQRYMLEDSAAAWLLTDEAPEAVAAVAPVAELGVVALRDVDGEGAPWRTAAVPRTMASPAWPRLPAYVIYTSGSTGRPKGVAVPHRGLVNLLEDFQRLAPVEPGDGCTVWGSFSFDLSMYEIYLSLLYGGTLHLLQGEDRHDPQRHFTYLRDHRVRNAYLPPFQLEAFREELRHRGPMSLRRLLIGVEPIDQGLLHDLQGLAPKLRPINGYGPTEVTVISTRYPLPEPVEGLSRRTPLGRAVSGLRHYVVDPGHHLVPPGVAGELLLAGIGLAQGYLGRPALTADRFRPDPFAPADAPGSRVYRTGDRVRYVEDQLVFLGRTDHQVKVRGFRIELGEVAAALESLPQVAEAVVVVREDVPGQAMLVGYWVPTEGAATGAPVDPETLRQQLRRELPDHMVPGAWVQLGALPRLPNDKIDRASLPRPTTSRGEGRAPITDTEIAVARVFAEILEVDEVTAQDSFFALGGHSLLATQAVARLRSHFEVEIPLPSFFEAATVEALATLVDAAAGSCLEGPPLPPLEVVGRPEGHLSYAQQRLWFLDRFDKTAAAYGLPVALELRGELDIDALGRALGALVQRHEILRTVYPERDGEGVARVQDPAAVPLPVESAADLASAVQTLEALEAEPFDLATGPLLRARLLRLGPRHQVLSLCQHHIISDGWSMGVMLRDLVEFYRSEISATAPRLPELPLQYLDFAAWQRRVLAEGPYLQRHLEAWRSLLRGIAPILELPTDRPRPAQPDPAGAVVRRWLPGAVTDSLEGFARRQGATPFMAFLAIFQALLHRLSGQATFSAGSPVAGRRFDELENLLGFFVNTQVLPADFRGTPSFADVLAATRRRVLAAAEHQDLPFERLVEELAPDRSLRHNPLFQVMLAYQNTPMPAVRLEGLAFQPLELSSGFAKFDWTLFVGRGDDESGPLPLALEYRRELFEETTVERYLGHLEHLLGAAVAEPRRPLGELPLLTDAERHQLLRTFNDTAAERPEPALLHALVVEQARRTPQATALLWTAEDGAEGHWTYAHLVDRAADFADRLRSQGVGCDHRVGIFLDRSPELVAALLGTLLAGAAYVPLDVDYPPQRIALMASDARLRAMLTDASLSDRLPPLDCPLVDTSLLFSDPQGSEPLPAADVPDSVPKLEAPAPSSPEAAAYVLYTSGSTGMPKGAVISHRAIHNHMVWMQQTYPLGAEDRVLQKTPISFDASVWEFWAPLMVGARLVLAAPGGHRDPAHLVRVMAQHRVTVLQGVPTLLDLLVDEPGFSRLTTLRRLYSGGERLAPELLARLRTTLDAEVINVYGPTEATIHASSWRCAVEDIIDGGEVPIGTPVGNGRAMVLDETLEPTPVGVGGQLFVAGAHLARGYFSRPAATAAAFLPDPHGERPGERMYATGDRARFRSDGALEFLGRRDHQIKLRGLRVEPGEIEAAARELEAVAWALVAVWDERLVLYVTPTPTLTAADGAEDTTEDVSLLEARLLDTLRCHLPAHMVPSAVVVLDRVPLLPNGKVDRGALPTPDPSGLRRGGLRPPRSSTEELLAQLWSAQLDVEEIGLDDHFFDLGGHSLLVTKMIARVRRSLQVEVPVRTVFEAPTLEAFAAAVDSLLGTEGSEAAPSLTAGSLIEPAPLSFTQERLWFLDLFSEGRLAYNIPLALELRGELSARQLQGALAVVEKRHAVLHTRFVEVSGRPFADAAGPGLGTLPVVDLADLSEPHRRRRAQTLAAAVARRPFDLARGPLWRACLVRLGAGHHTLLMALHHAVSDGRSMALLVDELMILMGSSMPRPAADTSALPALPVQYADFARWQREWVSGNRLERSVEGWRQRLAGSPALLELPLDRPRPKSQGHRGQQVLTHLPRALRQRIDAAAGALGTTPFMFLLAGFYALLARLTGKADVNVGSPVSGRHQPELEHLLGCFVNTVVLRADAAPSTAVAALVRRTREVVLDALEDQDVPFEMVVEAVAQRRDTSHSPLFQVFFAFQNTGETLPSHLGALELEPLAVDPGLARFDLALEVGTYEGAYSLRFELDADLLDHTTVARWSRTYGWLLEQMADQPAAPLASLVSLRRAESHQLRLEWNDTAVAIAADAAGAVNSVAEAFRRRAAVEPDRPILAFQGSWLTYGDLDRRSAAVASRLLRSDAGPGRVVGISMQRSPALVVALLGVLRAGAAYLPLDPEYPEDRLRRMAEDAAAVLVITDPGGDGHGVPTLEVAANGDPLSTESSDVEGAGAAPTEPAVGLGDLAYVIYTSGSTGHPKGVMVPHGTVLAFFAGMDRAVGAAPDALWMALTSISFDISVLELLWTLCRGHRVALHRGAATALRPSGAAASRRPIDFSLLYFASAVDDPADPYRLLMDGARFGDTHGFSAVWVPERHFHEFGGIFPNPSVAASAVAAITENLQIRSGSVVLPLHHPIRVAEEWSMVDNLSGGRVGLSFASGWHADDFVLVPQGVFPRRKEVMLEGIETIRRLWRGESVAGVNGVGRETSVAIYPKPRSPHLPIWVTAAGNPDTFRAAGELGANVLTHLLGQDVEELEGKIRIYRRAYRKSGRGPGRGHVSLMLHSFVGDNEETVKDIVRGPFVDYLKSSFNLLQRLAPSLGVDPSSESFGDDDMAALLEHAFQRYFGTSSLFGTPEKCAALVEGLKAVDVDEIACLIDFGVATDTALEGLEALARVRRQVNPQEAADNGDAAELSLAEEMLALGVTHLQATPSTVRLLLSDPAASQALGNLDALLLGGEALPADLVDELEGCGVGRILNMYGPTETTVWSAAEPVSEERPVSIGRPIAGTRIQLLDPRGRIVPTGVAGELCIGGAGVVRGYHRRAGLTAERFRPDPLGAAPGTRLYRTGDQARYLADGRLQFLGRRDHQIKLRGYRIELGEIEAALEEKREIAEAVVVARSFRNEARLVAYVVPVDGTALDPADLRRRLAGRLPIYMVPAQWVVLENLPLTPNGKVDRRALPDPQASAVVEASEAPSTQEEKVVAALFQELLGVEAVGVEGNFFELGGHSLMATQLFARIKESLGVEIPLRQLFEHPTVGEIAALCRHDQAPRPSAGTALEPVPRRLHHPLSLAQQRIWYLHQLDPEGAAYNDRAAFRLDGELDVAALHEAIRRVVQRHEALRSRFELVDGRGAQRVDDEAAVALPVVDLSAVTGDLAPQALADMLVELARRESHMPFDLETGPLLRPTLLRLGADRHAVLLTVHHIVWDGWSYGVFMGELTAFYEALRQGTELRLEPLEVQYIDFAHWQRERLQGEVLDELLGYWRGQLAGLKVQQLTPDRPRGGGARGRRLPFDFGPELLERVRRLAQQHNATLFMVLLAALDLVLASYHGGDDIVVGTDVANRTEAATEKLVGFFVNQLVMRTDLSGHPSFVQLLGRVRELSLAAYAHQDLPYDRLVDELRGEIDADSPQLFQVKLVLQNVPISQRQVEGLTLSPVEIPWENAKFDLLINVVDSESSLGGNFEFNTDLFDTATIEGVLQRLEQVLLRVTVEPSLSTDELRDEVDRWHREQQVQRRRQRANKGLAGLRKAQRRAVPVGTGSGADDST